MNDKILLERILFEEHTPDKVGDLEYDDVYRISVKLIQLINRWIEDIKQKNVPTNDVPENQYPEVGIKNIETNVFHLQKLLRQSSSSAGEILKPLIFAVKMCFEKLFIMASNVGPKQIDNIKELAKDLFFLIKPLFDIIKTSPKIYDSYDVQFMSDAVTSFNSIMKITKKQKENDFKDVLGQKEKMAGKLLKHIESYRNNLNNVNQNFLTERNLPLIRLLEKLTIGINSLFYRNISSRQIYDAMRYKIEYFLEDISELEIQISRSFVKKLEDLLEETRDSVYVKP